MTRAELIASLVHSMIAGMCANPDQSWHDMKDDVCDQAERIADEMIRRGIVTVSDAPKDDAPALTIQQRGWPGHCIVADRCRFRRNTLVKQGAIAIVVSTVGEFYQERGDQMPTTVGSGRYYETRAFYAKEEQEGYLDADISREFALTGQTAVSHWDPGSDNEANDMHEAAVSEVVKRIEMTAGKEGNA